jgi:Methyltransferase FkbM domain
MSHSQQLSRRRFLQVVVLIAGLLMAGALSVRHWRGAFWSSLKSQLQELLANPTLTDARTGHLPEAVVNALLKTTQTLVDSEVETTHYAAFFRWRAETLGGYRALYERFAATLDRAAKEAGERDFVACGMARRRQILQQIDPTRDRTATIYAMVFDRDALRFEKYVLVGIEANPDLADECRKTFRTAIAEGRLTVVEAAIVDPTQLSTSEQTVTFYRNAALSVWSTTSEAWATRNLRLGETGAKVQRLHLDSLARGETHGIPYYMKIDIEGADRVCLESLLAFNARPHYISIESEKVSFGKLKEEVNLLVRLGYTSFQPVQQAGEFAPERGTLAREGRSVAHVFPLDCSGPFGKDLPDNWMTSTTLLRRYRAIFSLYRVFGDSSLLRKSRLGWRAIRLLERLASRPLPGWYDTHARHSSARPIATPSL